VLAQIVKMVTEAQVTRRDPKLPTGFPVSLFPIVLARRRHRRRLVPGHGDIYKAWFRFGCPGHSGRAHSSWRSDGILVGTGVWCKTRLLIKTEPSTRKRIDVVVFDKTGTLTEGQPSDRR